MKYIASIMIGALIGYLTNWLAIKMLFRPYTEKYLFGIKMPFTPGLIPKEQKRIARSVGNAVGQYLLSEKTIIETLESENIQGSIHEGIKNKAEEICSMDITVKEAGEKLLGGNYDNAKNRACEKISSVIIESIRDDDNRKKISGLIQKGLKEALEKNPKELIERMKLENILVEKLHGIRDSDEAMAVVRSAIKKEIAEAVESNTSISDMLPDEMSDEIRIYIINRKEDIAAYIKNAILQPKIQDKIRGIVETTLSTKVSPFVSMFLNADTLSGKVMDFAGDYLMDESFQYDIALMISDAVNGVLSKDIGSLIEDERSEDKAADMISRVIFNDSISAIGVDALNGVINRHKTLDDMIKVLYPDYENAVEGCIDGAVEKILNGDEIIPAVREAVGSAAAKAEDCRIDSLCGQYKEKISHIAADKGCRLINRMIRTNGRNAVKILNISEIVENQINKFPVDMAERIILEIADKELKSITWVGALLGGLIGIVTPIISAFM